MWSTLLLYLSIWAVIAALARLLFASEPTSAQESMPNAASLFCKTDKLKEKQEKANGNSKADVKTGRIFAPGSTLLRCNSLSAAQRHKLAYLEEHCCVLPACAASMRVLTSPTAFYEEMLRRIAAAERSIVLSALYIADGPLSQHFVQCLSEKLEQWAELDAKEATEKESNTSHTHTSEPTRTITLLLDYNRMKDKHNLAPIQKLLERAYDLQHRPHVLTSSSFAVRLFLFQSPCRWNRLVAPFHRVQEALGVQHTKLFIFDHKHIVLTGANLSDDYFTTRMDRYLVIEDNAYVASWFTQLVMTLTELSHRVLTEAEYNKSKSDTIVPVKDTAHKIVRLHATRLVMLPNALGADPSEDYDYFVKVAALKMREFAAQVRDAFDGVAYKLLVEQQQEQEHQAKAVLNSDDNTNSTLVVKRNHDLHYDTVLFPTVQLGRLGIYHDSAIVHTLFATTAPTERIFLTSPYLNLYHDFLLSLLNGPARVDCITASVEANGWTGQRGMAGYIPYFYLQLERTFYFLVKDYHRLDRVTLREFAVAGMTFHAKGLWFAREAKQSVGTTTTPKESNTLPTSLAVPSIPSPSQLHTYPVSTLHHDTLHTSNEHVRDDDGEHENDTMMYVSPLTAEEKQDIAAPYLVSYGSTNYGHRSVHKDVEAEAFVYTANDALREAQRNELLHVLQQSRVVTQERFVRHSRGRFQPVVSLLAQLGQDFL